jgi:hypothetical protein
MRLGYCILVVEPAGYQHSGAFFEVAEWLRSALTRLGRNVLIGSAPMRERRNIVLGSNLLPPADELPADSILYNLEQIYFGSPWVTPELLRLFNRFEVWDYSARNAAAYPAIGLRVPKVVPIGFAPELERIQAAPQDIDVLFYGAWNDRRGQILGELKTAGLNVVHLYGVYGKTRDSFIARSKVILNMHQHAAQVFELVRVSYLLNNRRCIVSERGPDFTAERKLEGGIAFAAYEQLVKTCVELCSSPTDRIRISERGYLAFQRSRDLTALMRALTPREARKEVTVDG